MAILGHFALLYEDLICLLTFVMSVETITLVRTVQYVILICTVFFVFCVVGSFV